MTKKNDTKSKTMMSYEEQLRKKQEEERKKEYERQKRQNKTGRTPGQFAAKIQRLVAKTKDEDDPERGGGAGHQGGTCGSPARAPNAHDSAS